MELRQKRARSMELGAKAISDCGIRISDLKCLSDLLLRALLLLAPRAMLYALYWKSEIRDQFEIRSPKSAIQNWFCSSALPFALSEIPAPCS